MDILISSILCTLSSYLGYYISNLYKKEEIFFKNWNDYTDDLIREITFNKRPIGEITKNFVTNEKSSFMSILNIYLLFIDKKIDNNNFIKELEYKTISKKQNKLLTDFFISLGSMDYLNQINTLKNYSEQLKIKYDTSKKDYKTKGVLALKLGFLLGIAIMVLFV